MEQVDTNMEQAEPVERAGAQQPAPADGTAADATLPAPPPHEQQQQVEAQPEQQQQQSAAEAAATAVPAHMQQAVDQAEAAVAAAAAFEAAQAAAAAAAGAVAGPSGVAPAAAPAADAAAAHHQEDGSTLQPVPPNRPEHLSYAAIREAAAVNQAADGAADEAMRAVAAAHAAMHMLMNPPQPAPAADDGTSTHHPSGRARRSRSSTGYSDHAGASSMMALANGMYVAGTGRPNKGLRHFSMKVCEKVESKGTTTYNEVADELVAELKDGGMDDGICYDEKNIRRRVYDAINVLMALDIITKEKKAIMWRGFPTNRSPGQQLQRLQGEQLGLLTEAGRKAQYLADLVEQQRALKHLLDRNSKPDASKSGTALHLPFILVQSKPEATVEVQISPEMQDVQFNFFNYPFEIHDDALVLRKMLEHDNMQKFADQLAEGGMAIDGQMAMLTPEQQLQFMQHQQHQAAMAAVAAAAAAAGEQY